MPWLLPAAAAGYSIYQGVKGAQDKAAADAAAAKTAAANATASDNNFHVGQDPNAAARDVARYQAGAAGMVTRGAPVTDYTQANAARGSQADALSAMQSAAQGNAPSQAAGLMRSGNDQAMASQMSAAAGARGPMAMASAQQQAAGNAAGASVQNGVGVGAMRAQEMAQARGAYMSGATGMRGQDQDQAQYLSDLSMKQKGLNLKGQTSLEDMALHEKQMELQARLAKEGINEQRFRTQTALDANAVDRDTNVAVAGAKAGGEGLTYLTSDVRAKYEVKQEGVDPLSKLRGV